MPSTMVMASLTCAAFMESKQGLFLLECVYHLQVFSVVLDLDHFDKSRTDQETSSQAPVIDSCFNTIKNKMAMESLHPKPSLKTNAFCFWAFCFARSPLVNLNLSFNLSFNLFQKLKPKKHSFIKLHCRTGHPSNQALAFAEASYALPELFHVRKLCNKAV